MSSTFVSAFSFFLLFNFVFLSSFGNAKNHDDRPPSKLSQKYSTDIMKDNFSDIHAPKFEEETQNSSSQYDFLMNFNPGTLEDSLKQSFGYYTLVNNNHARMAYFFFESCNNQSDPVLIWLNGGPGVSSTVALFIENGPFRIAHDLSLLDNHYGWDGVSNILYIDQPIGTGLSFEDDHSQIRTNYKDIVVDLYDFLQQFFNDNKHNHGHQYRNNDFYITGQSFAGHYAPALASLILHGNSQRHMQINLKGIAIGNALIDMGIQFPCIPKYAYEKGLISPQQQNDVESIVPMCQRDILACAVDPTQCSVAQSTCAKLVDDTISHIRSNGFDNHVYNINKKNTSSPNYDYTKLVAFFNNDTVKLELGIPDGQFKAYNDDVFQALTADWAMSTQNLIADLLNQNISFLSYVGKLDLTFNHLGTFEAVKTLIWDNQTEFLSSIVEDVDFGFGKVGSKKRYGPLTYFEVPEAGNNVPGDQPRVALAMITHWMQGNF